MALQVCKECKAQVSSKAKACPSCGAPMNRGIDPGKGLLIVGTGCLIFFLAATSGNKSSPKSESTESTTYKQNYTLIARAEIEVRDKLKDPDSAKFGFSWSNKVVGGEEYVCGSVNSKNGFGGYAGERKYIYSSSQKSAFFEESGAEFKKIWMKLCSS